MDRPRITAPALAVAIELLLVSCVPPLSEDRDRPGGADGGGAPGIYVVDLGGSAPTRVAEDAAEPAWSPDGSRIAFVDQTGVITVNADGSERSHVARVGEFVGPPAWSPDGRRLAVVGDDELVVAGLDGSAPTTVPLPYVSAGQGMSHSLASQEPAWSPDGRRLAIEYGDRITVVEADGSGWTALTPGRDPAWSPDGARLAFRDGDGVFVVNADGSGRVRLADVGGPGGPSWSPDGSRLLFGSWVGATADLYVVGADGTGLANLTADYDGQADEPAWSPDGGRIAFTADGDIWVMGADGSGKRRLTTGDLDDAAPSWSPDGAKIAFSRSPVYIRD